MSLRTWLRSWLTTRPAARPARTRLSVLPLENRLVPSTFQGVVFNDLDGSGTRDPGEQGLAGWAVYVDVNRNAIPDPNETAATTDADGHYFFDTTNETPAVVATDGPGRVADYVGLVLDNTTAGPAGPAGRWLNTTATFDRAIRQTEPDAGYDFGLRFQPYTGFAPDGPESLVNVTTNGAQVAAPGQNVSPNVSVAADAAGNYVVTWTTEVPGGQNTIQARAFAADGAPGPGRSPSPPVRATGMPRWRWPGTGGSWSPGPGLPSSMGPPWGRCSPGRTWLTARPPGRR